MEAKQVKTEREIVPYLKKSHYDNKRAIRKESKELKTLINSFQKFEEDQLTPQSAFEAYHKGVQEQTKREVFETFMNFAVMKLKMFNKDERSRRIKFNDKHGKGIVKQITPEIDRDQPEIEYSG